MERCWIFTFVGTISQVSMENWFWCYFRQLFLSSAQFYKSKKVHSFCPLKTEIVRFPIGFRLANFNRSSHVVVFVVLRGNVLPNPLNFFLFFSFGILKLENSFRR